MKFVKSSLIILLIFFVNVSVIWAQEEQPELSFQAHVQNDGWLNSVPVGETVGTVGQNKNLEAFSIYASTGEIRYSSHVSTIGWQDFVSNGQESGTTGQGLSVEAIKIELGDSLKDSYDIYYRVHVAYLGWLDWAKNGQEAGSIGFGLPAQAFEVNLVPKDTVFAQDVEAHLITADTVQLYDKIEYEAHCADIGWQGIRSSGQTAGTQGEKRRIEALTINTPDIPSIFPGSDLEYEVHGQNYGWQDTKRNGDIAGTVGSGLAVQAIRIRLTGSAGIINDVYYRVHVANIGWLDWAKNGAEAGTTGLNYPIEAIEIKISPVTAEPPGVCDCPFYSRESLQSISVMIDSSMENVGWLDTVTDGGIVGNPGGGLGIEALKMSIPNLGGNSGIVYNLYLGNVGWQGDYANYDMAGTTGQNIQAEAISVRLAGTMANLFDIYYQVCSEEQGWLGWACNGDWAGTSQGAKSIEALRVWLIVKGDPVPQSDIPAYKEIEKRITASQVPNFNLICAIVQHEGGNNYEGALAVMSCVMNRCDSGRWGGTDPVSVLTAPGQFASYLDGYYKQFLNNPSPIVQQAVLDCLNGKRSHGYESFRSYPTTGSVNIGGNWFF